MKKKIFLTLAIVMVLTCLFAIGVSAEEVEKPTRTKIQVLESDIVLFDDGFSCPSAYIVKDQTGLAFDFTYTTALGKNYAVSNIVELDIPQGITFIGQYFFQKNTTLKKCSIPASVTTLQQCIFQQATGLEELVFEHTEDSELDHFPNWMVWGCTSLKALSMPDCITQMTGVGQFQGCTNLTAVYLSKNLESIGSGEGNTASFGACPKLFFVNEPFTYDSVPEEKPTVYYFPDNLTSLPSGGEVFKNCTNLNDVLVFPTGVTELSNSWAFCNANAIKIVFLGDMTDVCTTKNGNAWNKNITIYFCNENDKSASDLTMNTSAGKVFCYAEGNTDHLSEKTEEKAATCTEAKGVYEYCFCGQIINSTTEGDPLGHEQGELVSKYFPAIVNGDGSLNYFADMVTEHNCTRCDAIIEGTEPNTALFAADGYSIPEKDDSTCISHTIKVNKTNVAKYEALTGDKVDYGVVAGTSTSLSSPVVINNGEIEADTYALVGDMTGTEYTKLVIKVTGLEPGDQISCNAYIVFNKDSEKIYYLCGSTVTKTALPKSL